MDPKNQQPPPYPGYPPQQPGVYQPPYPPQGGAYPPQAGAYPNQGYQQQPYNAAYPPQQQQQQPAYGAFQGPPPPNMAGQQAAMAQAFRPQGGYDSDAEGGGMAGADGIGGSFGDKEIRRGFIKKVYGILSIQLLVTIAIITPFVVNDSAKLFVRQNRWTYWTAFGVTMAVMIALVCCESVRRKSPLNVICLGVFTVCEGILLGTVASYYETEAVLIAAGACAAVTIGLTIFAFQTKYDFTTCGGMLCGLLVVLMIAGFLMIFFPYNKYAQIGYGCAGALIFSMYIVYDTQLMMGGSHKMSISPEEYIFASLSLYLDIINLFLYILMIVGAARSD